MMRRKALTISLALAGVGLVGAPALAETKNWSASMGGKFNAAKNWKPAGSPHSIDVARFDLSGAYTVSFTSNRASQQLLFGNDKVVFDFNKHSYDVRYSRNGALALGLKAGDVARLTIRNGTLADYRAAIGAVAGATGNLTVSNAVWNTRTNLDIGNAGIGNLTILNGGKVSSANSSLGTAKGSKGTVTISSGGEWEVAQTLAVGSKFADSAAISIGNGADLTVKGLVDIRKGGTISLTGGKLSAGSISRIGKLDFVTGELELTKASFYVGKSGLFGATPTLLADQIISVKGTAQVAYRSVLTMDGGTLRAGQLTNSGEIRFNGRGALEGINLTNNGLLRGTGEVATLNVVNRGEIRAFGADYLLFDGNVSNAARINMLSSGTLEFTHSLVNNSTGTIGGDGTLRSPEAVLNYGLMAFGGDFALIDADVRNTGRVSITGPSATFLQDVTHDGTLFAASPASTALFLGDVSGSGNFSGGGAFRFEKGYNPGAVFVPPAQLGSPPLSMMEAAGSLARVRFDGNVSFGVNGQLTLDLGPLRAADRIDVTGDLYLGEVNIRLNPDFVPILGDEYTLITARNIDYGGAIHVPEGPFQIVTGQQALMLQVIPEPCGGALLLGIAGMLCLRRRR